MAEKRATDKFANIASITLQESAANTLTFAKLETGVALFEKMAWIIHRLEILYSTDIASVFNANADFTLVALCATNQITSIAGGATITNPAILYGRKFSRVDFGTAASGFVREEPFVVDFSTLPGGGLIVPPNPIYGAIQGNSEAAAALVYLRLYYTQYALAESEYWELVEARRIISG